jgi:hypothetical protein
MNGSLAKRLKYGAIGFAYGIFLTVSAVLANYAGYGSQVPSLIFIAPLMFIGNAAVFFLNPFLWLVVGIAISGTRRCSYWPAIGFIILHWLSAVYLLFTHDDSHDWMLFRRAWLVATLSNLVCFGVYLAGQIAVVSVLLRRYQSQRVCHPQG